MNRGEKAVEKFNNGYNCAQSVVMAFCDELGMSEEECAIMSEGFGGGMGRTRSVCGAVSGMVMLAGLKMSIPLGDVHFLVLFYKDKIVM